MSESLDPTTRQFLRFRDTGDPGAMAAVFDAVAPKLLLLAMHLVRDGTLAEDLVQTTFVQAIERCDGFDGRFPSVWAWLTQILRRRAVDLHRAERREARVREDGARVSDGSRLEDPAALLEAAEAADALRDAIDALPGHYRSVLIMRILHGMEPRQIAYALGTSPSTIRSRIKRGLDLVRRRIAPAAVSAGLVAWSPRGLAEIRKLVLERAARARPPVPASRALPRWVAPGLTAVGLLVPAVLLLAAARSAPGPIPPPTVDFATHGAVERAAPASGPGGMLRLPVGPVPTPPVGERGLEVVWARDGSPARGVSLSVRRADVQLGAAAHRVLTDEHGWAHLDAVAPGSYELCRCPQDRTVVAIPDGPCRLRFEAVSQSVTGRVVDHAGRPVVEGRVWQSFGPGPDGRFVEVLGADGSFRLEHASPGQRIACRLPDGRWSRAVRIEESSEVEVAVELELAASFVPVRMRVTTAEGCGVAGARGVAVPAHPREGVERAWPPLSVRSDADGRLSLLLPDGEGATAIEIEADGFATFRASVDRNARAEERTIVLEPGVTLAGWVADAAGRAVASAFVQVAAEGASTRRVVTDRAGAFRVAGLSSGAHAVFIDGGRAGVYSAELDLGARGELRRAFRVQPIHRVRGRVLDSRGRPAAGVVVRARRVDGQPTGWPVVTDEGGEFELSFRIPELHAIELGWRRALPPFAVRQGPFADGDRVDFAIPCDAVRPSAWLEGRIAGGPGPVELHHSSSTWRRFLRPRDGGRSFRFGPLPPGDYELWVGDRPFTTVRLREGQCVDTGEVRCVRTARYPRECGRTADGR